MALESSMQTFERIAQSLANTNTIGDKLSTVQQNVMTHVDQKLDKKISSFLSTMKDILEKNV
jgi:hypothetical protein